VSRLSNVASIREIVGLSPLLHVWVRLSCLLLVHVVRLCNALGLLRKMASREPEPVGIIAVERAKLRRNVVLGDAKPLGNRRFRKGEALKRVWAS
jgi:hypothetical protein